MRLAVARAKALAAGSFALLSGRRWTREQITQRQLRRLCALVCYVFDYVPFYRDLYSKAGVGLEDITSLADPGTIATGRVRAWENPAETKSTGRRLHSSVE